MTDRHEAGLAAVVFDFDGTLVDTEWPIFLGAQAALATFGVDLTDREWAGVVGLSDGEGGWYDTLCLRLGVNISRSAFDIAYEVARAERPSALEAPAEPGAADLVTNLAAEGVRLAVASGSPVSWLEYHLERLGLRHCFESLAGVDRVAGAGKPAPDVYLLACADLGVDPVGCVAIEDSVHGIAAAQGAGLACVAVPSRMTRHTDLTAADLVVEDFSALDLDVLVAVVNAPRNLSLG